MILSQKGGLNILLYPFWAFQNLSKSEKLFWDTTIITSNVMLCFYRGVAVLELDDHNKGPVQRAAIVLWPILLMHIVRSCAYLGPRHSLLLSKLQLYITKKSVIYILSPSTFQSDRRTFRVIEQIGFSNCLPY